MGARRWCYRPLHGETLECVLNAPNRLHPACGQAAAADRQQAKTAFILGKHVDWTLLGIGTCCLQPISRRGLKGLRRISVFLCGWGVGL